jgi:nicotinamidase-related amidase
VDRGYNCMIVDDACATLDQASHDAALLTFAKWFGRVAATRDAMALLGA